MILRFLKPAGGYRAGQIVKLSGLSAALSWYLQHGYAQIVQDDPPAAAPRPKARQLTLDLFTRSVACLYCGGDPTEPDHAAHCDGRQGHVDARADVPELDAAKSAQRREEGIAHSYDAASEDFKDRALRAVEHLARTRAEFLPDDVWPVLDGSGPPNNRALGGVMRRAAGLGWIELTDRFTRTAQVKSHRSYRVYWRSLIYRGDAQQGATG